MNYLDVLSDVNGLYTLIHLIVTVPMEVVAITFDLQLHYNHNKLNSLIYIKFC